MARERHTPEQIVAMLRQIEGEVANSKPTPQACREPGITEQTYYRWRKEHGGLKLEQARRLKELEKENTRLRRGGGRAFPGEASAETPLTASSVARSRVAAGSCRRTTSIFVGFANLP